MKYTFIVRNFCFILIAAVLFTACKRVKVAEPMGDAGQTLVKFIDGGTPAAPGGKLINIELTAEPQTFMAADLRRLIPNNTELNRPMNVVIKSDAGAVSAYNPALVALPENALTIASENAIIVGDEYRITLQPGQFAYNLSITLVNALNLDFSQSYGAGFTIYTVDADGVILDEAKSYVLEFGVKNIWDGVYRLYSGFFRSDLPNFVGVSLSPAGYYQPYNLITSGSNSVDATINTVDYGVTNTQIIYNTAAGYTYFTGVAPRININGTTNAVTVTEGIAAVGASVPFLQDATELSESKYYETGIAGHPVADGRPTIVAHFRWSSGGIDRVAKDTFVYLGPR
jgi:hypothetical protein